MRLLWIHGTAGFRSCMHSQSFFLATQKQSKSLADSDLRRFSAGFGYAYYAALCTAMHNQFRRDSCGPDPRSLAGG